MSRYGLALLGAAFIAGCSSGTDNTDPGTISLSVSPTSGSVQQGGQTTVTATLTRGGSFTGTVNLTVTGAPSGVTATVSNVVTTGATTTATVTINVAATTVPAVYPLVVHGTGTGVTEATANYSLTVTAAPAPAFTLTLSSPTLSIVQGGATPTTTVTLVRTNFTGNVTLSVENLPTGVTAAFNPVSPISGNSSVLTLTVAPTATPATTNLVVRGTATGLTDQTAPLALTITLAGSFTLAVTPAGGVTMAAGTSDASKTITITRTNYAPAITLTAENLPAGLTAVFVPNPAATNSSVLTLTATAGLAPNVYNLTIRGTGPAALRLPGDGDLASVEATTTLAVTVTAAAPSFTLSLTNATLSIAQGASTPTTTVNIARINFTGDVTLSVLNLPTGVTAAFAPANPQTGNSSVLTLTVAAGATTGTFTNLSVQGVGTAGTVATPLSLTITAGTPAPSFTLSLTQAALSIAQGASTPTTTVNITRTNFTGDVALSVLNLPTGVTAAFAPANPQTGNSSVLTLTVAAGATTGTFTNLSVQGVGTPGTVSTPLSLTITAGTPAGNFTLTTTPSGSASVTQGTAAQMTVNIVRTGGFAGAVTLTTTGLPAGLTFVYNPNPSTAASSTLQLTAAGSLAVGSYPNIVIHGNATGLAEQTVTITVNVTAPGGSGNVTVTFANCPAADKAVWLAFMDGTSGTWTAVTGAADVYHFNITQGKGSFAYVTLGTGTSEIFVQHSTQAELTAAPFDFCPGTVNPNTRVANGTVQNLPSTFLGQVSFGGGFAAVFADGAFQITNAMNSHFDLIGYAHPLAAPAISDRVFVKRGENPAPAGSFSVPVNFTDATLSFAPAIGAATLSGLVGTETLLNHSMNFFTGGSSCVPAPLYSTGTTAASFNIYGVPSPPRLGTDMHGITIITAIGSTSTRFMTENFLDVVARAATPFVLPAQLPVPVVTDAGGPYKRPKVVVTGVPAELNLAHSMTYTDQTVTGKFGFVSATQGWVGGSNLSLELPNFAGVGTFLNAWAPATGDAVDWTASSTGGTFTTVCAAGQRFVSSSRGGTLP